MAASGSAWRKVSPPPGAIPTRLAHPRGISAGHFLRKPTGEINGTAKSCTTPSVGL
jgi:hypothetical protein